MKINNQAEYDAAKIKLSGADESLIYYAELKAEMLEYRRANNIFEVGDLVVLPKSYSLDTIHKIVRIENLAPHAKNLELTYFLDNSLGCWLFQIQHATDAEIEANRRLDCEAKEVL